MVPTRAGMDLRDAAVISMTFDFPLAVTHTNVMYTSQYQGTNLIESRSRFDQTIVPYFADFACTTYVMNRRPTMKRLALWCGGRSSLILKCLGTRPSCLREFVPQHMFVPMKIVPMKILTIPGFFRRQTLHTCEEGQFVCALGMDWMHS